MPKTLKPKPLPPMTEARFKRWATQEASLHVTHFRRVLAALMYERQRADEWERKYKAVPPQHRNSIASVIMADMMRPPSG